MHLSLTFIIPHLWPTSRSSQEAACPDPDAPSRAEHQGLERSYAAVSRLLSTASVSIVYEDTKADLPSLRVTFPKYGGVHIHRVLFDEANDQPWNANCTMYHDAGSYATGCFGRRGPWGVFHLAQFDIGPGTLTNDMAANVSHTEWRSRWLKAGRSSYGRLWH